MSESMNEVSESMGHDGNMKTTLTFNDFPSGLLGNVFLLCSVVTKFLVSVKCVFCVDGPGDDDDPVEGGDLPGGIVLVVHVFVEKILQVLAG